MADEGGRLKTMNRPSGLLGARPIPVMLGIRRTEKGKLELGETENR